jgi:hypothetical protein
MKFIDRAFALAVAVFLVGAFIGAISIILSSNFRALANVLFEARMLSPIRTASRLGDIAVFLVIFLNNSVPAVLSFVYPLAVDKIRWTPPLSIRRRFLFLSAYTVISAFLSGFFSLGAALASAWVLGGTNLFLSLISGARIHGPLEFAFVLVCIAEPLRVSWVTKKGAAPRKLVDDRVLLPFSITGLLVSAAIEVFLGF